tara:strand:+ start:3640 stop:3981 length:342 start_codon:yes stop_codon:yes gene_type:complete
MFTPEGSSVTHPANLPVPFPIREPSIFLLNGKWGNRLNHVTRDVLSERREAFLRKSLIRKICLLLSRNGCRICNPMLAYVNLAFKAGLYEERRLNIFLNLNLRGLNNNYTSLV